jgi:hypothetical protein
MSHGIGHHVPDHAPSCNGTGASRWPSTHTRARTRARARARTHAKKQDAAGSSASARPGGGPPPDHDPGPAAAAAEASAAAAEALSRHFWAVGCVRARARAGPCVSDRRNAPKPYHGRSLQAAPGGENKSRHSTKRPPSPPRSAPLTLPHPTPAGIGIPATCAAVPRRLADSDLPASESAI